jgi:hypothetical protein
MDRYDYETLKDCLKHKDWYSSHDTVHTVGTILRNDCAINSVDQAFDYFEKPWHYEPEMRELVVEYEIRHILKDMSKLSLKDAATALNWLEAFGYDQEAVDQLEEDWQENHPEELCVAKS